MLDDPPSRSQIISHDSESELRGSTFRSESSFEGSHSGNLLDNSNDRDNLNSQNSANSLRGADESVMKKLRMRFQAYGLGATKQQSSELSFSDRKSTSRDRNSMHKKYSINSKSSLQNSPSVSNSLITGSSLRSGTSLMVTDETKMITQLRTLLKLAQSLEPMFVLNVKKRQNIFHAIKLYHKNENIARLSVTCLELLADRTKDKGVFAEIMKNFGNLAALVGAHVTNVEFSQKFLSLVVHIIKKDEAAMPQLDDPAYVETFWQIKNNHPSNKDIQGLHSIIADKLGMKKRGIDSNFQTPRGSIDDEKNKGDALSNLRRRMKAALPPHSKLALELADSQSSGYEYSSNLPSLSPSRTSIGMLDRGSISLLRRNTSDMDAQAIDEWAAGDLLGNDGDLVSWDSDDGDESVTNLQKSHSPIKSRTYTARRLKELQMQNAQREQSLTSHSEALAKLQQKYEKTQNQYQADETIYASFVTSMQEAENKFKEEIAKLKHENEMIKVTETDVCEQASTLVAEMEIVQAEMNEKNHQFENMKAMITQQMNQAKGHYVGVRQRLENARAQLTALQDKLLDTENKLTATQKDQAKKVEDYTYLQTTYQAKQREYEESRIKAANLENRYNTIRADLSSKIATNHQELAKGQSNIRLAHQMHGTFKSQLMKLKIERSAMVKNIQALEGLNSEGNLIDNELQRLRKENADLKARLGDLMKKDASGEKLREFQLLNEKLKKEKAELMGMTEMLLARTQSR